MRVITSEAFPFLSVCSITLPVIQGLQIAPSYILSSFIIIHIKSNRLVLVTWKQKSPLLNYLKDGSILAQASKDIFKKPQTPVFLVLLAMLITSTSYSFFKKNCFSSYRALLFLKRRVILDCMLISAKVTIGNL